MNILSYENDNYDKIANILKIIAHPIRLAILDILQDGNEECVCHLEAILGFRQAYLSQHLKAMREAEIVIDRREGRYIYYRIRKKTDFSNLLREIIKMTDEEVKTHSYETLECSCPKCIEKGKHKKKI